MAGAVPILAALSAVVGAVTTVSQARQQSGTLRLQAAQSDVARRSAELAAQGEEVRGQSAALDVREQLLRTLSSQRARYAAAGVALDSGAPLTLAEETEDLADRQLSLVDSQTRINAASRRLQGASSGIRGGLLTDQADQVETLAPVSAGISLVNTGINLFDTLPGTVKRPERTRAGGIG
jgi:hypothetical protein